VITKLFEEEFDNIITNEMIDWYIKRTDNHIKLVQKYGNKICNLNPRNSRELYLRLQQHDELKWKYPELKPYIILTWEYYCKDNNIKFYISDKLRNIINQAKEHHILNSQHHPEYWQDKKEGLINKNDRDDIPNDIIDATKMDGLSIKEMCADWCAMSEERKNSPFEWTEKVINKRWKFSEDQIKLIYFILESIWNKK